MRKLPPKKKTGKVEKIQNTLLVDGNALYKRGFIGAKNQYNSQGKPIGGIYQFLTMLRKLLNEDLYHKTFCFWDGNFSGKLRWNIYKDYKSNRGKDYINGTKPDDYNEVLQRGIVFNYLEELFIRQLLHPEVESDDFIAYYCGTKRKGEKITIVTSDRDLCQLMNDDVRIYMLDLKTYVTKANYNLFFKHHIDNSALIKIIGGDSSDNIKGIKGVKEPTLLKYFPELIERKVTLKEIIDKAKELQEIRLSEKKKPLKVFDNIINSITEGIQGVDIYDINKQLVDLTVPLISKDALEQVDELIDSPLSDDRSIKAVYKMLKKDGIDIVLGESRFADYLLPFKKLIEREKKNNILN
jgi:5'-3' exonuclease